MSQEIPALSEKLVKAFHHFILYAPPERLNRNLRTLLIEYIGDNYEFLPPDFNRWIDDMSLLFDLLDIAVEETKGWHVVEGEVSEV